MMSALEKRLQAQITAQNLVIEALLEAAIKVGLLDARQLVERLEQYVEAPKADGVEPETVALLAGEVNAWADMVFDLYGDQTAKVPARSSL
ncbi:hypothetical protein LH427_04825 [Laribacter hongkongensis]|uniref:hypothetical protein n=1 Tax=Laribacter hongkongensis TaxID=168471 RepID=UPI001EFD5727|nr:hypothetical protein [Laribacter hongkongensis]MCG8991470.1 hypothetical protein [Laribacter hongkongensis]MCG8997726.1 hypothetical protein [Laribacter hongkongensis]MCG9001248.1 hypothetical protein [Laribacter hongkongensis]MCG9003056.1 hypothetical protein [Laribacter hongkongensis]MCG9007456.1 hypothetical protein [Laribacter hongkongensis]